MTTLLMAMKKSRGAKFFKALKQPIKGFFKSVGLWLFPKKIHLVYGKGGKGTLIEREVMEHMRKLKLQCTWYFLSIDEITWRRPNQIIMVHSGLKGTWRDNDMKRYQDKYGIEIRYFDTTAELKNLASAFAWN